MMVLVVGLIVFLGIHLLPTSPELRNGLEARLGYGPYRALFSLLSLAGFIIIVLGYHKLQLHPGKNPVLWDPPLWTRHITIALMLPAMILLAAFAIPSRIGKALKHPMLAAIKVWALAHLLSNGDLGSILLFGSFLAYAVYDRILIKRQGRPVSSRIAAPAGPLNDIAVIVVGVGLFLAMLLGGHQLLIGVSPLG